MKVHTTEKEPELDSLLELLLRLSWILKQPSILQFKDEIAIIRKDVAELVSDEKWEEINSEIKTKVQCEAENAWLANECKGMLVMATGSGKSRVAVNIVTNLNNTGINAKVLLIVPTEKLRDEGWKNEFHKWGNFMDWEVVTRECYASLHKYKNTSWDLVIFDECHNLTELNSEFFADNTITDILCMTATPPASLVKKDILNDNRIQTVYTINLNDAVDLGLVAPYDVTIVTMTLDDKDRYVKAGRKDKPFFNTEQGQYNWLSRAIYSDNATAFAYLNRMRFIYNLKSKTDAAKMLLEHVIPEDLKTIIFCGTKAQANEVCEHRYYSAPTKPKKLKAGVMPTPEAAIKHAYLTEQYNHNIKQYQDDISLNAFIRDEIIRLSCVAALNEGHNIDNLDVGLIVQLDAQQLNFVQRIGRVLRFRVGHIGRIIILCVQGTVDEDWVMKATRALSPERVRWVSLEKLRTREETILFD